MKMYPRHRRILETIRRFESCCPNLLWQASGVVRCEVPCRQLKRAGLIEWKEVDPFRAKRPSGWVLTDKGKKLLAKGGTPR